MSLGTMKPFGAAALFLAVANILSATDTNDLSKSPSPISSSTPSTVLGTKAEVEESKNNSTSAPKESSTQTTTTWLSITTTNNTAENEAFAANDTDARASRNDNATNASKESSAPTTATRLSTTTHNTTKDEDSSISKMYVDNSTGVHKTSSASTTIATLSTNTTDRIASKESIGTTEKKSGLGTASLPSGSNIILPVFIPLGLVLFFAVAVVLYKMCKKSPPETLVLSGEEAQSAAEKPASKNESVKLLSVKTSPEAGENSSQRRNKTLQNDESSPHLDHNYI